MFTIILFPCLIKNLCDTEGVPGIPGVDHIVEFTRMADVYLIKDVDKSMYYIEHNHLHLQVWPTLKGLLC